MAKTCPISKKTSVVGGGYSNRTRATKFNPTGKQRKRINIQKKRLFVPSLKKTVIIHTTSKGLRTMKKNGVEKTLRENALI